MSGAPGPDGRHDDLDADELAGLALLVPDDPRSLDADRVAYLRDLRDRAGEGGPIARLRARAGSGRLGMTGPTIVLVLAFVAVIGSSLTLFTPRAGTSTALIAPLATNPPAGVGNIGGLLPDTQVMVDGTSVPLRAYPPCAASSWPPRC